MNRVMKCLLLLLSLCMATSTYGQTHEKNQHVRKGNRLYEEQRMEESQREYISALQRDSLLLEALFNLGDSQYAMGNFASAENMFRGLLEGDFPMNDERRAKVYYNLGNAQFQQQKLEEALESYKSSLRLNPSDMEAKFNYAYTKAMLENQQNQDQNQNQNQDQQNNQDNQQQPENQEGDDKQQPEQNNPEQQPEDGEDNQQPNEPQGDKPEPSDEGEEPREMPSPSPESEQMLNAVQAAEDKTREKVDAEREAVGIARSGKNW